MHQGHRVAERIRLLIAGGACVWLVGSAVAHDEDWRKLVNLEPPVLGEIWTLANATQGGADPRTTFPAVGVTLYAHLPLNTFPGGHTSGADCWGYVSPSGREYGIMGLERGYGFVEITDPSTPVVVATIPGPTSLWHDVKVVGHYAYGVSDQTGVGVQIMDMSDIDNGVVTLVANSTAGGFTTAHNIICNPDSGRLFICGANVGNGGLVELDISNPESPQIASGWTQMYVHDAQVVTYTEGPYAGREIAFCASGLDGGFTSTGMRIVDVTTPGNFFTVSTLFYSTPSYSHQNWLSEDRHYLYLNDELDEMDGLVSQTTTRIIDVSDLSNPVQAGFFTSGLDSTDHNLYTVGEVIIESNYQSGVRIFDGSDPLHPVQIGYIDTYPPNDNTGFNGTWSNYPFFPSGNAIISDINRGLFVVGIEALGPRLRIHLVDGAPEILPSTGGQSLEISVEEIDLSVNPDQVTLNIITPAGQVSIPGVPTGSPGGFTFTTPPLNCGDEANFWFSVRADNGHLFTLPSGYPDIVFKAPVADSVAVNFDDDFETNQGWSVSGNATDGQWTRGVPVGGGDRGDPPNDYDGSGQCYLTDNVDGNSDVDNGSTILTSPAMDAGSGEGKAYLSYATWFSNTAGSGAGEDTMVVEISNNNGGSWQPLETIGPSGVEASGGWYAKSWVLNDLFATPSDQVRVRFTANDLGTGSVVEAGVDAVQVRVYECAEVNPCPADLAEPFGQLDFSDIIAFLEAFSAQEAAADLAEPFGQWDFSDVIAYLAAFGAGCP
ncbi:MAG: choice-of-anchor B family protein [Phycisphaerales bacterium]